MILYHVDRSVRYFIVSVALLLPCLVAAEDGAGFAGESAFQSNVDQRLEMEKDAEANRFAILPHKPNYILPLSYSFNPNQKPWKNFGAGAAPIRKAEIKFQISIKVPLAHDLLMDGDTLYAGYTQKSFWQAYSKAISAPFRDTNFNPEIFYRMPVKADVLGLHARMLTVGFEHESNGRAEPLSRSWNRIYGLTVLEKGNLTFGAKVWYRIPEKAAVDNNPDIIHYLGYGELYGNYKHDKQQFGVMFRPSLVAGFSPGVQVDWSFPLLDNLHGYVQYYSGYGESLIDYNHYNNRIGVGIMINNWL